MATYEIDPDARLDYQFDWRAWLKQDETIVSHVLSVTTGITLDGDSETGGVVTVWVKDGQLGTAPVVTCHVVTSAGREDDRSITLVVQER